MSESIATLLGVVCARKHGGTAQPCCSMCVCIYMWVCVRMFLGWLPLPVARCPLPCLADNWRASKAKHVNILLYKAIARVKGVGGVPFVIILVVAIFVTVAATLVVVVVIAGGGCGGGGGGLVVVAVDDCGDGGGRFSCCCCCWCRGVRCNSLRYVATLALPIYVHLHMAELWLSGVANAKAEEVQWQRQRQRQRRCQ